MSDNVSQDIPAESVDEGVTEDVEPEVATAENAVEEAGSTSDQIEETTESVEPEIVAKQPIETQEVVEDVIPVPDRSAEEVPISNVEEVPVSSVEEVIPPVSSVEEVILPVSAPEVSTTKKPEASRSEGTGCFQFAQQIHPSILELVRWQNPVHSAVALCVLTSLLVLLRVTPVLSVLSLWMLCMLLVAVSFRIVVATVLTFQKKPLVNPLEQYIGTGLPFPVEEEMVVDFVSCCVRTTARALEYVRQCLLIRNVGASFKFFLHLVTIYNISSFFSVLTLLTIGVLAAFAIPPFYERNQALVDGYLKIACTKYNAIVAQARALPVIGSLLPKEKTA